jgi:dienelactone hydrolase
VNFSAADQTRLVIVGATGMVGGYALRYALGHPAIGLVTAIGRRMLGISHPKLKEVLHPDFADCSALADALSSQSAAVFCLGAYTGAVSDAELRKITVDYTDLAGVVTFHAALNTPRPEDAKNIMGKVLVLHGADDPLAPDAEVPAFEKEMRDANVDWPLISYGNTVHSFTNWDLDSDHSKPAAYNAKSDARSWAAMRTFFEEILGRSVCTWTHTACRGAPL